MPKKVTFPPPKDDVPAWFMTYSDVVTLLMTFFILLLTFATMEPEKFDKIDRPVSTNQAATGRTGIESKKTPNDSWITRIRPASARIAMRGAEMPPIMEAPVKKTFGQGLKRLTPEENKHNELESHYFDVALNRLLSSDGSISSEGALLLGEIAKQLRDVPFQAAFQYSNPDNARQVTQLMMHMFEQEKIRPGQLGMTLIRNENLTSDCVRVLVKRFLVKPT
jgi:flagellar motor protein MotB